MRCSAYGTIVPSSSDPVRDLLFIDGRSRDKCLNDQRRVSPAIIQIAKMIRPAIADLTTAFRGEGSSAVPMREV